MTNHKQKLFKYTAVVALSAMSFACGGTEKNTETDQESEDMKDRIELVRDDAAKKVDVIIDGKFFTSYIYPDSLEKPVLYPINTANETAITRGWPVTPRPGERVDHPHHLGLWFNYGDVNGLDFWNNSSAIEDKTNYGHIVHKSIKSIKSGNEEGVLEVSLDWMNSTGEVLLTENTTFIFRGKDDQRTIDRIATLTAPNGEVKLTDNKEGMLGLRTARQLEHPSDKPEIFTDASGKATDVPTMNNEGITGMYKSSEGVEGNDVWGTRGSWVSLSGKINNEDISVAILDFPSNPGYPTYWHARGYGLFAANPLGQKALSNGKDELNFKLAKGESATFKYRIIIYSNESIMDGQVNRDYIEWAK
ncbi:methane monooxygenase PmoA-like [Algoriphagus antarcticus]|uniref:Methane monooxygenase PmoA-like n=2 Tax=Algoriphagus antarcticus TaxID=238540 RepID=A0A3E0E7T0_9BACT|nr:PmoA family protein [Algoriphagus antarcticus]REG94285.1 methane monooxygenase PmoA-like [Algoriphagus antarcticus]